MLAIDSLLGREIVDQSLHLDHDPSILCNLLTGLILNIYIMTNSKVDWVMIYITHIFDNMALIIQFG